MVWQIRRTDQSDGSDQVQPGTHATAALAYDTAMDNAQARAKAKFLADPSLNAIKLKLYRDTVGAKGLRIVLQTVDEEEMVWYVEEV